jgi:hypothetical protein
MMSSDPGTHGSVHAAEDDAVAVCAVKIDQQNKQTVNNLTTLVMMIRWKPFFFVMIKSDDDRNQFADGC